MTGIGPSTHITVMSDQTVLSPEDFATTTGEDPAEWPARFEPGTFAKVISNGEAFWTKVTLDDGRSIRAVVKNNLFGDFAHFDDPVEYRRENVREILPSEG